MGLLSAALRGQQQPQGVVRVNKNHPFSRWLTFAYGGGTTEAVSGRSGEPTALTRVGTNHGIGTYASSRAVGNGLDFDRGPWTRDGTTYFSIAFVADLIAPTSSDTYNTLISLQPYANRGSNANPFQIYVEKTTNKLIAIHTRSGFVNRSAEASGYTSSGVALYVATFSLGTVTIYRNGIDVTTATPSTTWVSEPSAADSLTLHNIGDWVYNNTVTPVLGAACFSGRVFSAAEVAQAFGQPNEFWALFESSRILLPIITGGGATQALTGVSATTTAGTLTPSITIAITGQAATAAAGTITPTQAATQALTGAAATAAAGTLAPSLTVALAGSTATTAAGTIAAGGDVSVNISGSSATTSAGAVGVIVDATRALTGVAGTTAAGTITAGADITQALTGAAGTAAAGTITPTQAAVVALTGQQILANTGTITPQITVSLSGISSTASAGTVSATSGIVVALSGAAATISPGTLGITASATLALSGLNATVSAGTILAATPDITLALSGLGVTAYAGSMYLQGVWIPVVDTNANTWNPVVDTAGNTWNNI